MASRNDRNQRPSARQNTSAAARPSRDGRKAPQQNKAPRNVAPTHNPGDYSSYLSLVLRNETRGMGRRPNAKASVGSISFRLHT